MTLQELKESIEDRTFSPSTMVIVSEDKFLPMMYLREIERNLGYKLNYVESIYDIGADEDDIFGATVSSNKELTILNTDKIEACNDTIFRESNVVVVANSISPEAKTFYRNILIEVPKIVDWQLQDMVYSYCKGVDTKYLDWLIKECNGDIYRLYNESLKLSIFSEADRPILFEKMNDDGAFDDLTSNSIFNLTNAIVKKDVQLVKAMYADIKVMGISDFGLLSVLYNNFMSMVQIQLGISPTAEKLGMKQSQFNAIRYNCGKYSNNQLVNIVKMLSDIDRKIKCGEMPTSTVIDYIIISILSA
jgi:hypothetical protein